MLEGHVVHREVSLDCDAPPHPPCPLPELRSEDLASAEVCVRAETVREELRVACLSRVTIEDVVETCGLSWDTVAEIDQLRQKRLGRPDLRGWQRLAIDAARVGKLHRFLTLVHDLDGGAIVSVSKGRGQKALTGFFSWLKRVGVTINAVATDMAGGYTAAAMKHLWPTQLVFDRFHVVK